MNKIILLALFVGLAASLRLPTSSEEELDLHEQLHHGSHKFFLSLNSALKKNAASPNQFYSPHSIYHALLLSYFGGAGETEKQLQEVLGLDGIKSKDDILRLYRFTKNMRAERLDEQEIEFKSVDKFFVSEEVELTKTMTKLDDEVEKVDFRTNPEGVRQYINQWVEEVTKNKIKDLLPKSSIFSSTNLVLANAAYFKGKWENKFIARKTESKVFHGITPAPVQMMKQKSKFVYGENEALDASFIQMPYTGEDGATVMYVLLPKQNSPTAVDDMLDQLTPEVLDDVLTGGWKQEVEVEFPKLKLESEFTLGETLRDMGIHNLFHDADFSGISETSILGVDDMIHKAVLEIDEEGATAAAATASFSRSMSFALAETQKFICDHPFFYIIYDKTFNEVLFAGVYRQA